MTFDDSVVTEPVKDNAETPTGRYDICFDTEFHTDEDFVRLISIGAVDQFGRSYYAEVKEFNWRRVPGDNWLQDNVRPHLLGAEFCKPAKTIARELAEWASGKPRFWAYYGAYDWVALCMLYGGFRNMPLNWSKYYWELQTYRNMIDPGIGAPKKFAIEHHALQDAHWNMKFLKQMQAEKARRDE